MDELAEEVLDEIYRVFFVSGQFKCFEIAVRRKEGEVVPEDINDRTQIDSAGGGVGQREV